LKAFAVRRKLLTARNRDWSLSHPLGSLRDRDPVRIRIGGSG
jgi:hypothetical protein